MKERDRLLFISPNTSCAEHWEVYIYIYIYTNTHTHTRTHTCTHAHTSHHKKFFHKGKLKSGKLEMPLILHGIRHDSQRMLTPALETPDSFSLRRSLSSLSAILPVFSWSTCTHTHTQGHGKGSKVPVENGGIGEARERKERRRRRCEREMDRYLLPTQVGVNMPLAPPLTLSLLFPRIHPPIIPWTDPSFSSSFYFFPPFTPALPNVRPPPPTPQHGKRAQKQ